MDFWTIFWQITLIGALSVFGLMAIVVAIGGFANVLALFRSIDAQHAEPTREEDDGDSPEGQPTHNSS